jgi:hypothetical protein
MPVMEPVQEGKIIYYGLCSSIVARLAEPVYNGGEFHSIETCPVLVQEPESNSDIVMFWIPTSVGMVKGKLTKR